MEIDKIKEIIKLMKDNDLKKISLKNKDHELYLEAHSNNNAPVQFEEPLVSTQSAPTSKSNDAKSETKLIEVRANQIGIFYTQPDEDSTDTFVKVGDRVKVGDQIGLIEIMKLFNEVLVEDAGVIEEILVANGEPVEYDQVLILLRPEEE